MVNTFIYFLYIYIPTFPKALTHVLPPLCFYPVNFHLGHDREETITLPL